MPANRQCDFRRRQASNPNFPTRHFREVAGPLAQARAQPLARLLFEGRVAGNAARALSIRVSDGSCALRCHRSSLPGLRNRRVRTPIGPYETPNSALIASASIRHVQDGLQFASLHSLTAKVHGGCPDGIIAVIMAVPAFAAFHRCRNCSQAYTTGSPSTMSWTLCSCSAVSFGRLPERWPSSNASMPLRSYRASHSDTLERETPNFDASSPLVRPFEFWSTTLQRVATRSIPARFAWRANRSSSLYLSRANTTLRGRTALV